MGKIIIKATKTQYLEGHLEGGNLPCHSKILIFYARYYIFFNSIFSECQKLLISEILNKPMNT